MGTWYSSNAWPWGVWLRYDGYKLEYALNEKKDWSTLSEFKYDSSHNQYLFKWVNDQYYATIQGNTLTVKGATGEEGFFIGTFKRE